MAFDRARVTSVDWASYPILRFPEVPDVMIDLVSRPTEPIAGRRRGGDDSGAGGARERRLRCDRPAAADGAVHARTRQGGAGVTRVKRTGVRVSIRMWSRSRVIV
mgnify:CR=1 FL=1